MSTYSDRTLISSLSSQSGRSARGSNRRGPGSQSSTNPRRATTTQSHSTIDRSYQCQPRYKNANAWTKATVDADVEYLYRNWEEHRATGGYGENGSRGNKGHGTLEQEIETGVLQFWLDRDPRGPGWGPYGYNPEGYTGTAGQHYAGPGMEGPAEVRMDQWYGRWGGEEGYYDEEYDGENDGMGPRRGGRGGRGYR